MEWIKGVLRYIVSYALRFIVALVILTLFLFILNNLGLL